MEKRMTSRGRQCLSFITQLSVEPMAILIFVAFHLWFTCFQTGLYKVVCYQKFHTNRTVNCANVTDKEVGNEIQQELAKWFMILMLSSVIPGMISSCLLGAWSDLAGRKTNLVLSITGFVIAAFPLSVVFTFPSTPLFIVAVAMFICGCMGFMALIFTSSMAYLYDTVLDKEQMTIRMVIFSVFSSVAGIIGALLSGVLIGKASLPVIVVIVEALFALSIVYVLIRLEQLPPSAMRKKVLTKQYKINPTAVNDLAKVKPQTTTTGNTPPAVIENKTVENEKAGGMEKFINVSKITFQLINDIVRTYTKSRPGKQQTFLILTALILFINMMADIGVKGNIIGQYVFNQPFRWDGSKLGYWRAATGALHLVGNLLGIVIFKKVLKLRDTTIMLIAILSCIGELILLGVSTADWMLYVAIALGCLSNLLMPTVASFTTQIVSEEEVGKSFVAHGLASCVAFMLSTAVFQSIYKATLNYYPGFVFLFGAGIMVVCFAIILWIHIVSMQKTKVIDVDSTKLQNLPAVAP